MTRDVCDPLSIALGVLVETVYFWRMFFFVTLHMYVMYVDLLCRTS